MEQTSDNGQRLKAEELRIGNWVKYNWYLMADDMLEGGDPNNTACVTTGVLSYIKDGNKPKYKERPVYQPMPLTEVWLSKFGAFKKEGDAWWTLPLPDMKELGQTSNLRICKGIVFVEQVLHQGMTQVRAAKIIVEHEAKHGEIDDDKFHMILRRNSICVERSIEYVHQLQNLYFALTGSELTLKETVI
jgi:hypothetical protein